mmetsp:Transcript_25393/g.71036  ORF Transcript_25393/g.71036 Transcript_25393/m.71036 type:complete len:202 (+) Transcript_25393:208-813(+)
MDSLEGFEQGRAFSSGAWNQRQLFPPNSAPLPPCLSTLSRNTPPSSWSTSPGRGQTTKTQVSCTQTTNQGPKGKETLPAGLCPSSWHLLPLGPCSVCIPLLPPCLLQRCLDIGPYLPAGWLEVGPEMPLYQRQNLVPHCPCDLLKLCVNRALPLVLPLHDLGRSKPCAPLDRRFSFPPWPRDSLPHGVLCELSPFPPRPRA